MSNIFKEIWTGDKVAQVTKIESNTLTFRMFADKLRNNCERLEVTAAEFDNLQKVERSQLKDGRYFCGTSFIAPSRRDTNCATVQVICIDIDDHESALVANPAALKTALTNYSWLLYSTVSSRPDALRYRLVVDASGEIPADFYPRCVATIGKLVNLPLVSTESFTLSQPMYSPKVCSDVELTFHSSTDGRPFAESDIDFGLEVHGKLTRAAAEDLGGLMYLESPLDISTEEVEAALEHLSPDMSYPEWIKIAGAIKHQYQLDKEEGYRVFLEWCKGGGTRYTGEADCLKLWRSIQSNPDKTPATIRTVLHLASKQGWKRETSSEDEGFQTIREAITLAITHDALLKAVPAMMQTTMLPPEDFETLVAALRKQVQAVLQLPYPVGKLRALCKFKGGAHIYEAEDGKMVNDKTEVKPWSEHFCYLSIYGEYYDRAGHQQFKPPILDSVYGRYMMTQEEILQGLARPATRPCDYLDNVAQVPIFEYLGYHPAEGETFKFGGREVLNSYRDTAPKPSKDDETYQQVKHTIDNHFATLIEDREQARTIMDYLAYIVQNPGCKLTWAILLQGTYGNGKSFLYSLMNKALGSGNATTIDAEALQSDFNEYAQGSQICFIEEMRLSDRREHAIMGKMKTMVSNETLQIRLMYTPRYSIPNVTNYVLMTNEKDAIHIDRNDRRYYIVCTKQQCKEDIKRDMPTGYFDTLFSVLDHPRAVRRYFEEWKVSPSFEPKGRAKDTQSKAEFVEHSLNDIDLALADILEDTEQKEILNATCIKRDMDLDMDARWGQLKLSASKLAKSLNRRGYTNIGRFRIGGDKVTLWKHSTACVHAAKNPVSYYVEGGEEL